MSSHEHEGPRATSGDETLNREWQRASAEQPSASLDAAIIASARKAVEGREVPPPLVRGGSRSRVWLARWQPMATAAAVTGLALVLVQLLPRDREVAPAIRIEEPASSRATAQKELHRLPAAEASDAKAAQPSESAAPAEPLATAERALTPMAVPAPAAAAPPAAVPPPVPVDSAADVADAAARSTAMSDAELDQRTGTAAKASSGVTSAEAVASRQERRRNGEMQLGAADRAASVATLYASGDTVGAAAALREFRAANPDADKYLPVSLHDWARTVE
jgi:hypothetical protein